MNLIQEAISGIRWIALARIVKQILQFITILVLARILQPEDFGLLAAAMIVIGLLNIFRDLGIAASIIQKKNPTQNLISSLFWINVFVGISIAVLLVFIANPISRFFNTSELIPILQALAFNFIISSTSVIHQSLLEKELKFELIAKFDTLSAILGSVAGIGFAFFGFGVWSLVIQVMVTTFVFSLLIWVRKVWKPSLIIDFGELKSVVGFSSNLFGFNLLNYLVRNSDYLLIQKYLGERLLGYYNLAYRIMLYPLENISAIVSRVMFPYYSKIQVNNADYRISYLKITNSIALITFPMMLWLMSSSEMFVLVLLGDKWSQVINLLVVLAPVGLIQSIYTPAGVIFQSKGRTDWWFRWGLLTAVLTISAFIVGLNWGIIGVAIAYLIVTVLTFYPGLSIPFRLIDLKVSVFLKSLSKTFFISLIVCIIVFYLNSIVKGYLGITYTLIFSVMIYLTLYLFITFKLNKEKMQELLLFINIPNSNTGNTEK